MTESGLIVHLFDGGFCSGSAYSLPRWPDGIEPKGPPNGTVVDCGVCGKMGVLPDLGHEQEWVRAAFEGQGATVTEENGALKATWA